MSDEKSLTQNQFDEVINRAAELSANEPEGGQSRLDESELFRIAREVGLSETHVRRALAEVRGEELAHQEEAGFFGGTIVHASRTVPGEAEDIAKTLDGFLIGESLLQPVRTGPSLRTYKPANDMASDLARSLSRKKHHVVSAKGVEVQLDPAGESSTHVQLSADFSGHRADSLVLAWLAGLGAGGGLTGAGIVVAYTLGLPLLVGGGLGAVVGGLAGWASVLGVRNSWRKKRREILQEVEGILDKLETGQPLRRPPLKWRRWIQDQLKGLGLDREPGDGP